MIAVAVFLIALVFSRKLSIDAEYGGNLIVIVTWLVL